MVCWDLEHQYHVFHGACTFSSSVNQDPVGNLYNWIMLITNNRDIVFIIVFAAMISRTYQESITKPHIYPHVGNEGNLSSAN